MPFTGEHHFILDNIEHRYQVFTGEAPDPTLVQVGDLFHPQDVGPYCEILVCKYTSGSIRQSWVPFSLVLPVKHPKHLARILLNPMGLWKSQKTARRQWEDIKSMFKSFCWFVAECRRIQAQIANGLESSRSPDHLAWRTIMHQNDSALDPQPN